MYRECVGIKRPELLLSSVPSLLNKALHFVQHVHVEEKIVSNHSAIFNISHREQIIVHNCFQTEKTTSRYD